MQSMFSLILLLMTFASFAQSEEVCEDPAQSSEALELASQIEKVEESKFSDKFCKAFAACGEFSMKASQEAHLKAMQEHYEKLPEQIEKAKADLESAKTKLAEATEEYKEWHQHKVSFAEKKLVDLEADKQKYDLHLSAPSKYPHPMKEKGYGLTPEEKIAYDQEKMLEQWGNYYKSIAANPSVSSEEVWKEIDELAAKSPIDWQTIANKYQGLTFSQSNETDAKIAKAYAEDPSKLLDLLKEKGIGLKPEEMPAFQKKQTEDYYKGLSPKISEMEKILSILSKKMEELSSSDPNGELNAMAQWKSYYDQQLVDLKKNYDKYLAYKADPSSDPDFLTKGIGGFGGGYGGNGAYGGYASMGGGMVGGFNGGSSGGSSSSQVSCNEARSNYQSAVSSMSSYGAGSCGLSEEELSALKFYSNSGYGCLNSYLRSTDHRDENIDYMIQVMNSGLDKLPSYQGVVKRGASLPDSIREAHSVGTVLEYDAFTSTSTNHGFSGKDMFIIQSQSGKPIMGFSSHRSENEVLFKSGTKFKILDKTEKDGIHYYIMAEVPDEKAKTPKAESIISLGTDVDPTYAPTSNADTFLCPVEEKSQIPKVLKQTVVPQFSFPAGAP